MADATNRGGAFGARVLRREDRRLITGRGRYVSDVTLPNPLFDGDTLYADTQVVEVRETRSRPGWGVVKVRQRGIKQDGTIVLVMTRTFMIPTKANGPERSHFPSPKD